MLTLYYVAATWLQSWRLSTVLQKIQQVHRKNGSLALQREVSSIVCSGPGSPLHLEISSVASELCVNSHESYIGDLLWYSNNKRAASVFPKQVLDISGWISVIPGRTHFPIQLTGTSEPLDDDIVYVMIEADYLTCRYNYSKPVIEVESYGTPYAWFVSDRMCLLMKTDDTKLSHLFLTFFQNNVTLENGIEILRIQTVEPTGTPYKIQNSASVPETYASLDSCFNEAEMKNGFMDRWRAHVSMLCTFCEAVANVKETQQDIAVRHPGSGVGAVKLMPGEESPVPSAVADSEKCASVVTDSTRCSSRQSVSPFNSDVSTAVGSAKLAADSVATSMSSLRSLPTTPRRTVHTGVTESSPAKPPNIIIFSDSPSSCESTKTTLESTLISDRYTIHTLSLAEMQSTSWLRQASLVVIHGNVPPPFTAPIMNYLFQTNASLLCLCSDFLGFILPMFKTAEVRPNELVRCSYKSWKHVPLMHHVFCYQPAPSTPQFSHDEPSSLKTIPESVEVTDSSGKAHSLKIDILGVEETWQTPSLLLVTFKNSTSKIVFSQVHLEVDPGQYENDEQKRLALEKSDKARMEILKDVLQNHLGIQCVDKKPTVTYTHGYFLGNHEVKQKLMDKLKKEEKLDSNNVLSCGGDLVLKFCGKGAKPSPATSANLPILMYSCPESFSTIEYFDSLQTEHLGRLVLFSEVMTTSKDVVEGLEWMHGFTVIPYYQTQGKGRGQTKWLSPKGCAMFSIQLHIPLASYLGNYPSLVQHITSLAVVSSICQLAGLEELDIGIKWPNDIYANKTVKIGGSMVKTVTSGDHIIFNVGCGVNLWNKEPTICINDMVKAHAAEKKVKIPELTYEKYFALVFNKMEEILKSIDEGRVVEFYDQYYNYWLHSDAEVEIKTETSTVKAVIRGIDDYGYLNVLTSSGEVMTVQPDGNSFDLLNGLIAPKLAG